MTMDSTKTDRPALIIFDCDGVLVDSREATIYFYNYIRQGLGLPPMPAEEEDYVFAATLAEGFKRVVPPEKRELGRKVQKTISFSDYLSRITRTPGAASFLTTLKELGVKTAVNTNAKSDVHKTLQAMDLEGFFDLVVSASDVSRPKPDPEGVNQILEFFALPPDRAAYIGDSLLDQQAARAAGVPFWAFDNPGLDAELHLNDFHLLTKMFKNGGPVPGDVANGRKK